MPGQSIEEVLESHTASLMAMPGVVAVGIGEQDGRPCLVVLTDSSSAGTGSQIPAELGGFPVVTDESGPINAL